jgi:hypothetical protein
MRTSSEPGEYISAAAMVKSSLGPFCHAARFSLLPSVAPSSCAMSQMKQELVFERFYRELPRVAEP